MKLLTGRLSACDLQKYQWYPLPVTPALQIYSNNSTGTVPEADIPTTGKAHTTKQQRIRWAAADEECSVSKKWRSRTLTHRGTLTRRHCHPSALQIGSSRDVSINEIPVKVDHHQDGSGVLTKPPKHNMQVMSLLACEIPADSTKSILKCTTSCSHAQAHI